MECKFSTLVAEYEQHDKNGKQGLQCIQEVLVTLLRPKTMYDVWISSTFVACQETSQDLHEDTSKPFDRVTSCSPIWWATFTISCQVNKDLFPFTGGENRTNRWWQQQHTEESRLDRPNGFSYDPPLVEDSSWGLQTLHKRLSGSCIRCHFSDQWPDCRDHYRTCHPSSQKPLRSYFLNWK